MKRKLISMSCHYIMGHPEIKNKIPVRLYREEGDIVIVDQDRVEQGRISLDSIQNLILDSKTALKAGLAVAKLGTLKTPGFLGAGQIRPRDRMLLINWRLPNNCLITTVFEYSGIFARFKAEIADSEFRKIMHEIRSTSGR